MAVSKKAVGAERSLQSSENRAKKESASGKATASRTVSSRAKSSGTGGRRPSGKRGGTGSKRAKSSADRRKSLEEMNAYQDHQAFETGVTIFAILLLSVFLYLSCFGLAGKVGTVIGGLFFGIFGWFVYFLPLCSLIGFIFYTVNRGDRRVPRRIFSFAGIVLTLLGLSDQIFGKQIISEYYTSNHVLHRNYFECMFMTCEDVMEQGKFNGGLIGRAVGTVFSSLIGTVGAVVILFILLCLCLYIFYGVEMMGMLRKRNAYRQEMEEIYEEVSKEETYREPSYRVFSGHARAGAVSSGHGRKHFTPREMEKAPRVQTFDLTKMTAGEKKAGKKPAERKAVEVETAELQGGKKPERLEDEINAASQEHTAKEVDTEAIQELTADVEIPDMRSEIEAIPIYRNELDEKFGKKRRMAAGARVVSFATAADKKTTEGTTDVEHTGSQDVIKEEMRYVGRTDALQDGMDQLLPSEMAQAEASAEGDMGSASQAYEGEGSRDGDIWENGWHEEVPGSDVQSECWDEGGAVQEDSRYGDEPDQTVLSGAMPEGQADVFDAVHVLQSEKREDAERTVAEPEDDAERISEVGMLQELEHTYDAEDDTLPELQNPPGSQEQRRPLTVREQGGQRKQASSRGKIGGDDYVSASDTFNALNESKVAVQEDVPYEVPPVDLLSVPEEAAGKISDSELRMTASKLQDTLKSFNVNVRMGAVTCGPTVTRYELFPEQGVRVNKITNLADDLKLSLAAASIRIEAPIPGKAAVGIEVPNPVPSSVYFRELLEGDAFSNAKSDMTFAVGKDIGGKLIMADIAKMPHLLIAGATGSGKSVCINTLIMSILYKADPKDVKLIMIDPKVVELSVYNGIPHLFCPVVTDAKEAAAALNWAVREMMDRYNKFKELGVRNIAGYNEKIKTVENAEAAGYARMPYLVVIVDEFADLMMVASKEVEDAVCRLAQLARAAGIHLVLATQRPSVNVITGVIKANIPSRIAFSVSSVIDSRTILDKGGAEKLLGKGDMLFFPSGYSEPVRVQGAFVSDKEVSDVVEFLCSNNETPEYDHSVTQIVEEPEEEKTEKKPQDDRDEYFADAGRFVIESNRAAAGQLQRRFSIGFNRAGRIIDQLNKAGVVGPAEGTKPRKVLMTIEEFEQMLSGGTIEDEAEAMVREMEAEAVTTEEMY